MTNTFEVGKTYTGKNAYDKEITVRVVSISKYYITITGDYNGKFKLWKETVSEPECIFVGKRHCYDTYCVKATSIIEGE